MNFAKHATVLGLIAGSAMALGAVPAQAFSFGNGGIQFNEDTTVDFSFKSSQGAFKSTLSIVEAANKDTSVFNLFTETKAFDSTTPDFMGTCPKTVSNSQNGVSCQNSFTFKGGVNYSLLLDSTPNGKVYSTDALNTPGSNQALVFQGVVLPPYNPPFGQVSANPFIGPVTISFDDKGGGNDKDFQDFIITAEAKKDVPEPAALAGLGLVAGTMTLIRRRRNNKVS